MKNLQYYITIFMEEFHTRMTYHTLKDKAGSITDDELRLTRDISKCTPASEYLDSNTFELMKEALMNGFGDRDLSEFVRAAKLGAKTGKKSCVDILILAIQYAREEGQSLIRDATF